MVYRMLVTLDMNAEGLGRNTNWLKCWNWTQFLVTFGYKRSELVSSKLTMFGLKKLGFTKIQDQQVHVRLDWSWLKEFIFICQVSIVPYSLLPSSLPQGSMWSHSNPRGEHSNRGGAAGGPISRGKMAAQSCQCRSFLPLLTSFPNNRIGNWDSALISRRNDIGLMDCEQYQ
jgi:hypothetical protein